MVECKRCEGAGKTVLFTSVEDPCIECKGSGKVPAKESVNPEDAGNGRFIYSHILKNYLPEKYPLYWVRTLYTDMDVVTTSGPATGKAPSLDKIQQMKWAMGTNELAIASGITPDNVAKFLPYVDHILVSTGISEGFHSFDPVEVERLIKIVCNNNQKEEFKMKKDREIEGPIFPNFPESLKRKIERALFPDKDPENLFLHTGFYKEDMIEMFKEAGGIYIGLNHYTNMEYYHGQGDDSILSVTRLLALCDAMETDDISIRVDNNGEGHNFLFICIKGGLADQLTFE